MYKEKAIKNKNHYCTTQDSGKKKEKNNEEKFEANNSNICIKCSKKLVKRMIQKTELVYSCF